MHSIKRFAARIGSAAALAAFTLTGAFAPASAQTAPAIWFQNARLVFTHAASQNNDVAVALHDPAVQSLLKATGASVAWQPGERYVLVTTAEPKIVSFAIGDRRYDLGDVSGQAAFAPFERNGDAYLPLYALARALYLEPKNDRGTIVLQPQIAVAEIQSQRDVAALVLHAALPLTSKKISATGGRIVYDFPGFGSTLEPARKVHASGLSEIDVRMSGTTRSPDTKITLVLSPGANAADGTTGNYHDFSVALSAGGNARHLNAPPSPPPVAQNTPTPEPAPGELATASPEPAIAAVTGVASLQNGSDFDIEIGVTGNATYEWHRLLDNRWYVDIHGATLQAPPGDTQQSAPNVSSVRMHQLAGGTVRVALTLTGQKQVDVTPTDKGLSIVVRDNDADLASRVGTGTIGAQAMANVTPSAVPSDWKYGSPSPGAPASANPRLIVIDPGHGGSDGGAARGSLSEKTLNLDISKRLRAILVARGWQVQMTRTTDVDVYQPNDSAHDELQARVDVANQNGARLFVSIHINSFSNGGPSGTTTYYYKAQDLAFANAVHRRLAGASLGTKDDGVIKNNFYVVVHSVMPAVLIETAFLSNPDDYAHLSSPEFLQKIAQAVADGIGDYAGQPNASAQNTQR